MFKPFWSHLVAIYCKYQLASIRQITCSGRIKPLDDTHVIMSLDIIWNKMACWLLYEAIQFTDLWSQMWSTLTENDLILHSVVHKFQLAFLTFSCIHFWPYSYFWRDTSHKLASVQVQRVQPVRFLLTTSQDFRIKITKNVFFLLYLFYFSTSYFQTVEREIFSYIKRFLLRQTPESIALSRIYININKWYFKFLICVTLLLTCLFSQ